MNRLFSIILLSLSFILSGESQKIGYINSQEILASLPEVKQANSDIEVMKTMFRKKGEDMVKELQGKYQDLQKKQQSGELAPVDIDKQSALLKLEEAKLSDFEKSSQDKIYQKSEELLQPIQDRVNKAIKDVATENGFLYIFDAGMGVILYSDPAGDATKLVKMKLGIAPQPEK